MTQAMYGLDTNERKATPEAPLLPTLSKYAALTFERFQEQNRLRCEEVFRALDKWTPSDWACAAAGELGEACNLIKKRLRGEDVATADIADEIADCVTYLDLLASRLGVNLGDTIKSKFNRVSRRRKCKRKL